MSLKIRFAVIDRIAKRTICGALAAWVIWIGITRWNGVPADPRGVDAKFSPPRPVDPAKDRTAELVAVIEFLNEHEVDLALPEPPDGKKCPSDLKTLFNYMTVDSARGPWSPSERSSQKQLINYLCQIPQVWQKLDSLLEVEPGEFDSKQVDPRSFSWACDLLIFRSRYLREGLREVEEGIADLLAGYNLVALCYNTSDFFYPFNYCYGIGSFHGPNRAISVEVAIFTESSLIKEFRFLAFEESLSRSQKEMIEERLRGLLPDQEAIWDHAADEHIAWMRQIVDLWFTDDGQENGWLVLSRLVGGSVAFPLPETTQRSGCWNIFSPFFNDRRTVTRKIEKLQNELEEIGRLSYRDGRAKVDALPYDSFNYLDGPLESYHRFSSRPSFKFEKMFSNIAHRRALVVDLGLSVYRTEHGEYPDTLKELIGEYLHEVPKDPFDDAEFRYRREGPNDYLLYSVGSDMIDDGGREQEIDSKDFKTFDLVFRHHRKEAIWEPTLEEIKP